MELKQMAEYKKSGNYKEIVQWAEGKDIGSIDNEEKLFFVAEAYEKLGMVEKCIQTYERGLHKFQDDLVPERLFHIYRQRNDAAGLERLKEWLEENAMSDDIVLLINFEILRIQKASTVELTDALKEYLEEYNDELYFLLLLELFVELRDSAQANRYLNKYQRLFVSKKYESYYKNISATILDGSMKLPSDSVRKLIYARTLTETEAEPKEASVNQGVIKPKSTAKPTQKVRIKTKNLVEALSSLVSSPKNKHQNLNPPSIDERFADVVGMAEIKDKLGNVYRTFRSQQLRKSNDFNSQLLTSTHFAITGAHGTGKTMLAEIIGQLLMDFGIRGSEEAVSIEARDFGANLQGINGLDDVTLIIDNLDRCMDPSGKYGEFTWQLRSFLIEHKENVSVILTGSKDAILKLYEGEREIRRLIYETLDIESYSSKELGEIFEKIAEAQKWILTEEALELVKKQLMKEKHMSIFECGNTMIEKLQDAAKRAADRMDELDDPTDEDMVTLLAEDFERSSVNASVPELLEKLENMTGLESVKEQVNAIVGKLVTAKNAEKAGSERTMSDQPLHMIFKGAPGTGKTTVARIIADIYMALGVLPGNEEGLVEVSAPDICGQYVGETAQKTMAVVNRAMGGVLFVDEAYTLTDNQFGKEALNTLLKVMEDSRDSIMIIFAGYVQDIDKLLDVNPGLRSRMPTHVMFEDYSEEELILIFRSMVEKDKRMLDRDTSDTIRELIRAGSKSLDFGNARGVRNLVGQVETALDERLFQMVASGKQPSINDYEIIRKEDIEAVLNHATDGSKTLEELLEDINGMEGLAELKIILNQTVNSVKAAQLKKEMGMEINSELDNLHMVFTGGPGTGKTTVARKIGHIYKALGILPRGNVVNECSRPELVGEYSGQTAPKVMDMINHSMGGVLFIDEAYTLSRDKGDTFGKEAIDTLVKSMEDQRGKFMIILAGYTEDMDNFLDQNPGLRSRIAHTVNFEDFSIDQMVSIFTSMANKSGYMLEPDAVGAVRRLLEERSKEKDFGNARGVRNVWKSVLGAVDERIVQQPEITQEECYTVKKADVEKLMPKTSEKEEKSVEELLDDLNAMIGLGSVKAKVKEIVDQAMFNKMAAERGLGSLSDHGSLHLLFKGNAGTGKTTVAQMLGQIYKQLGVLKKGTCMTYTRNDLVASYVGQTAIKTQECIDKAMGGIMFVDEAYTLAQGGENDFGQEALTTIMTAMENHRDDFMVIFAGYSNEIDALIDMNQGLESRFPKQNEIIFEDYTEEELLQIFIYQAKKKGMIIGDELHEALLQVIRSAKQNARSFGNARAVRNIVEAVDIRRKQRIMAMGSKSMELTNEEFMTVLLEDLVGIGV